MIDTISVLLQDGYEYIRKHPQLLMTLILIVVIPVGFLMSGQQFLNAAKDNQERLEKDRIGMMHDVFASLLKTTNFNSQLVQNEIESVASHNPDIKKFRVAKEDGDVVKIIASLDIESVGTWDDEPETYRISNINPNESLIVPYAESGVRYWESYRLVRSNNGDDYYIYTETSLEYIDSLFASRIVTAYYWLCSILIVVLLLLLRHVKLIDYAYLYKETKKANEMKDLFTNMIAHELRAPLTAMRGYASMIRERDGVSDEVLEYASRIEDSSLRLVAVVSDLLDVARIHSGKLSISKEELNIQKTISAVIEGMESTAKEKGISISREGILGDIYITSDEKRLFQALSNLVSNSLKYTKAGAITLSIEDRKDRIEIRIKDTGMGISAENQKNLFAPFFRVEGKEMDSTIGTGLGMWITKQLIELLRGSIAVESIRGVGTHVVVTLPKK